ncbi:MAG: NAD(P)-dependent glycerol-3-phosphate dehydrogenase [Erysipelotrichaceae bacterium]|nr:NAD(P)-dependent glycerol-3-phosphate dehydrogenase [Erysipelotrichaceae bacterium]
MKIGVCGTGSWGTALAQVLCDNDRDVIMYGNQPTEVNEINELHKNSRYFSCDINRNIKATTDINVLKDVDVILLAVPVMAMESVLNQLKDILVKKVYVINVAKGFYPKNDERLSVMIRDFVGDKAIDVISLIGPSHAEEVILRMLTLVNAVCENDESAEVIQELFANDYFRVYRNNDVVGAEIAAAIKNVMAIASGTLCGLGQGDNARAALMTRGLAEMTRFGMFFGGKPETFLGLNGVGDLIVTCSSVHSRNFQAGLAIGKADSAKEFLANNTKTTEGINTARAVHELAQKYDISMPISEEVYKVLYENKKPSVAIKELMGRSLKKEYI